MAQDTWLGRQVYPMLAHKGDCKDVSGEEASSEDREPLGSRHSPV